MKFPSIVKHEIEYLHRKVHELPLKAAETCDDKTLQETRYEKVFHTGVVNSDYKKMLHETTKVTPSKGSKELKMAAEKGKKFKVIVEGGVCFL